jgi:uncharacterized protein
VNRFAQLTRPRRPLALAALLIAALASRAAAADAEQGITVVGLGEAKGKPAVATMSGMVTGQAEVAADAAVKFRDALRRVTEAAGKLGVANLTLEEGGVSVNGSMTPGGFAAMMGGDAEPKTGYEVSKEVRLKFALEGQTEPQLVESMTKVLDAMKEAGLELGVGGPTSMMEMQMVGAQRPVAVHFTLADADAVREEASKTAVEDARRKAERLARLTGVKLGRVVAVEEVADEGANHQAQMAYIAFFAGENGKPESTLTTGKFEAVPVIVSLRVRFAIE